MTDIYVGEKGKIIYTDTGFVLTSATGVQIHFSAPSGGTSFVNSASVSVLASNVTASACGLIFSASKTTKYIINSADFDVAGTWKGWIEADFGATVHLISTSFRFKVSNPG